MLLDTFNWFLVKDDSTKNEIAVRNSTPPPMHLISTKNSLSDKLRDPSLSTDSFRRQLKTFLFVD